MKFIKLTEIWSGEFWLNSNAIKYMSENRNSTGKDGLKASAYIQYGEQDAANVVETIEEIMEMINNGD